MYVYHLYTTMNFIGIIKMFTFLLASRSEFGMC